MKKIPLILSVALVVVSVLSVQASPIITEFMASNGAVLVDEDGEFSDWIEIHNPDAAAVNLDGYFLTDAAADLSGWELPAISLGAGDYLVVFASGKDRRDAAAELHTDFKLSAGGGYLGLVAPDGVTVLSDFGPVYSEQFEDQSYGVGTFGSVTEELLVMEGASLRYLIPTDGSLATVWNGTAYDDAGWSSGVAGIGFETAGSTLEPAVETNISTEMKGVNASGYFRFKFNYSAAGKQLQSLNLAVTSDDGYVAYLNGTEVASIFAPEPLLWNSGATGNTSDVNVLAFPYTTTISATLGILNDGENVLAIQGMNRTVGGSDFLLEPVLTAEVMDVTGAEREGYFDVPTPGLPNSGGQAAGPVFVAVTEKLPQPLAGTDLVLVAQVGEVGSEVTAVTVSYRVMYGAESTVEMLDDGVAPDVVGGDGIYAATIPGTSYVKGEMIRWRYEAVDQLGMMTKFPAFREPLDSHQYVGTVALNPDVNTLLSVVETFYQNPAAAEGLAGTRGAVFYLGELYDNVYVNRHGQSTGGFPKKSFNIDFNKTQRFRWHPDEKRVKDIDLLTNWADKSKTRHVLSYEIMRESGVAAHFAFTVRVQQNGQFFSVADFVEDADDIYLERAGLNPKGALYKMYDTTLSIGNSTVSPAVEKKNRREEGNQDLADFIIGSNSGTVEQQWAYIYDNVNLPMMVNMAAANCVIRNTDMHRKNWYFYRDSGESDEWATLPWDLDLAHGRRWNATNTYFDNGLMTDGFVQVGTAVSLIQKMWARPAVREMLNRRIRTLSERFLDEPGTPYAERYFERRLDELAALVDPPSIVPSDAQLDFEKWGSWLQNGVVVPYTNTDPAVETMAEGIERWKTDYLPGRRNEIFNVQTSIPDSQSGQIPYITTDLVTAGDASVVSNDVRVKVPTDGAEDAIWMELGFDDSSWALGSTGVGFDSSSYLPLIGYDTRSEMQGIQGSVYMRIPFEVVDPAGFQLLELQMQYDDGYVAYLNGVEIHRRFAPATPVWNSTATTTSQEAVVSQFEIFDVSAYVGELVVGSNVLAIHGMNGTISSSDFLIRANLVAGVPDTNGSVEPLIEFGAIEFSPESGNQDEEYIELINNNGIAVDVSDWELGGGVDFTFLGGTVIPANSSLFVSPNVKSFRGRALSPKGGEQRYVVGGYKGHLSSFGESLELRDASGALNSETSYVGAPTDVQLYLVVSEIMYHPEPDGEAEFIELMNVSDTVVLDLTGVRFTAGMTFDFTGSAVTSLAPGQRVLVVKNLAAFEAAQGVGLPVAGEFALLSSLSNGGETLKLEDADGGTIKEFVYDDQSPWPTLPDTAGYSLVLIAPETNPDPGEPTNWRASLVVGGSPGSGDGTTFSGDPDADEDGDGLSALLEYGLGTSESDAASGERVTSSGVVEVTGVRYPTFTYQVNPAAMDVQVSVETSMDLDLWVDVGVGGVEMGSVTNADGTVSKTLRWSEEFSGEGQRYFRVRVDLN